MSRIQISKKLVFINSASSAMSLIINLSVLVWLQQFLLKRISPEEYSLIPILMSIMAFTPLLTVILTGGLGRYITVAYAKGDDDEVTRICSTMFPILLSMGLILLIVGLLGAWNIDKLIVVAPELVVDAQIMMALLISSAAIRLPLAVFGSGLLIRQKLFLEDMINLGCQLLRVVILLSLLYGVSTKVLWVIIAMVISELINLIITTKISIRLVPALCVRAGYWRSELAINITNYGGWTFINQIAETIKQALVPLILNRFATAVDVSTFYVGGLAPRSLKLMLRPLTRPFIPILASMYATGDIERLRNTHLRAARYNSWLLHSIAIPVIFFSNEIIYFYLDGKYSDAGSIMRILLMGLVLSTLNMLGPAIVAAAGEVKGLALRVLPMYMINILLTIIFVVYLEKGALGAAVAVLITVIFIEVTVIWPFCRKISNTTTLQWLQEVVFPCFTPAIFSILFCLIIQRTIDINTWPQIVIIIAISFVIYFFFVLFYGLRQQDQVDIARIAERSSGIVKRIMFYFAGKNE